MAEYEEDGMAVAAAKILLSLRSRKLHRWPEWVPRPSKEAASAAAGKLRRPPEEPLEAVEWELPPLPVGWPKQRRSPPRVQAKGAAWSLSLEGLLARMGYGGSAGSGASSSAEDGARSPQRGREKSKVKVESMALRRPEIPPYYGAAAGSSPSTSGVDGARSQPRPHPGEKAQAKVAARKETMAASSPETPLDYATAAGSGASSSGDEGTRSPAKRKAPGPSGSGGASSGDEGCSSPAKRTRADAAAGDGAATAAAVNFEEPEIGEDYRDEKGHLLFDLNDDINISW